MPELRTRGRREGLLFNGRGEIERRQLNWVANRTKPSLEYMPAIIRFLGYNPVPPGNGWAERLVQCRTALGIPNVDRGYTFSGREVNLEPGQQIDVPLV